MSGCQEKPAIVSVLSLEAFSAFSFRVGSSGQEERVVQHTCGP